MATPTETTWKIEPHTQAKHEILRRYLGAWFPILGKGYGRIVYIDGFCGPGRYEGGEIGSPVIALQEAKKHADRLQQKQLSFLFLDVDERRTAHLEAEIKQIELPSNFTVQVRQGQFDVEFQRLLDELDSQNLKIAPTFAFIDPFGFKGVPFDLVSRLLSNRSCEVLIYFPIDSINRWLEHPDAKTRQHIVDLLGVDDLQEMLQLPGDRMENLRLLYQRQLAKVARFVRFFEMRNSNDRTIYDLFFASNHSLGHKKMKEAFWAVDSSGGYQFSDATNPDQLLLFDEDPIPELVQSLQEHFTGRTVSVDKVISWVDDKTPNIEKHTKEALKRLEASNGITVQPAKMDGKTRRKNTFPANAIVSF